MSRSVMCRVSNELVINPAPLVNNGLTAPFPGQIYEMSAVPVPDGAVIDSQLITDASGAEPTAASLPDETWAVVYEGRPDAARNFGLVPFKDPWGVVLEVKGTSSTQPSERPIWRWTVTYVLRHADACPKGAGPQAVEVSSAAVIKADIKKVKAAIAMLNSSVSDSDASEAADSLRAVAVEFDEGSAVRVDLDRAVMLAHDVAKNLTRRSRLTDATEAQLLARAHTEKEIATRDVEAALKALTALAAR